MFDTTTGNRGVIAGGWTFEYPSDAVITSPQTLVPLPATGTRSGPAGAYPITFDLTSVPVGVDVTRVVVDVTMQHTFPDDVRLVLQSPSGTAVALMANAGGAVDLAPGTVLTFADGGVAMTDAGPLVTGVYSPGQVFGAGSAIPARALLSLTGSSFAEFVGEPVRGTWNLYAYDATGADAGQITSVTLTIENEIFPNPQLAPIPATSTQPFTRLESPLSGPSARITRRGGSPTAPARRTSTPARSFRCLAPTPSLPTSRSKPARTRSRIVWGTPGASR